MSSKKTKKIKQENKEEENTDVDNTKRSKKRKLAVLETEGEAAVDVAPENSHDESIKPKKKKKKIKADPEESIYENGNELSETANSTIIDDGKSGENLKTSMPQKDLLELFRRMEEQIPSNDSVSFRSRADKLNWNDITFNSYTVEDCKETWNFIQKKIRRFRLLQEVLKDAKDFVENPPKIKRNIYPGMPRKPPTGYQLFYRKRKPQVLLETPGLEVGGLSKHISQLYKNLPQEKRNKYEKLATQYKAEYDEELEAFYKNHPECKRIEKPTKDKKPIKPRTPFMLYFENQLRKNGNVTTDDHQNKTGLKDQCKEQWKKLSAKKKMVWITKSEQELQKYAEEIKTYAETHPDFVPVTIKQVLSKEELTLKDRFSGKPEKPPNSAYGLFSKQLLQSEEIKTVSPRDRMNYIANRWKDCTEDEKNEYKAKSNELLEQYKIDYDRYVNSLPDDKKQAELLKNAPKKKKKAEDATKKRNFKGKSEKIREPVTPPISALRYYADVNKVDVKKAKKSWRKLTNAEKEEYEKKLVEVKREYILEFERFLNSLSKEELQEYSKNKQEIKLNDDDFEDDSSSSGDSDDEESD